MYVLTIDSRRCKRISVIIINEIYFIIKQSKQNNNKNGVSI